MERKENVVMYPHLMQAEIARAENDRRLQQIRERDLAHREAAKARRKAPAAAARSGGIGGLVLVLARALGFKQAGDQPPEPHVGPVALRLARPGDDPAIERVAMLDASPVPPGQLVVAVVEGRVAAAISLRSGKTVRDPFAPTAHLIPLLELRARQLNGETDKRQLSNRGREHRLQTS